MKLYYVAHARMPTEKAHGAAIARMCEAFAAQGVRVTLVVPRRKTQFEQDMFNTYSVKRLFEVRFLPVIDVLRVATGKGAFFLQLGVFYAAVSLYFLFRPRRDTIVYTREVGLLFLTFLGFRVVHESHDGPAHAGGWFSRLLYRRAYRIVATSHLIERAFIEQSIERSKLIVAPNAVDIERFSVHADKAGIRKELGIPLDTRVCVYTGHLYARKGADVLARAASKLPPNVLVYLVGGTQQDVDAFRRTWGATRNLHIVGHRPFPQMPLWQSAADVLVLPNSASDPLSRSYTSPLKLFEYMASRRPIVASNVPSLREALTDEMALFVEPDNEEALALGIKTLLADRDRASELASRARHTVEAYTWENRARIILGAVS